MIRVAFTPNLQRHVDCPPADVEIEGATVRQVLDAVFAEHERLRGYVLDECGSLRKHMTIFVNGVQISDRVSLTDSLPAECEIFIFQALSDG